MRDSKPILPKGKTLIAPRAATSLPDAINVFLFRSLNRPSIILLGLIIFLLTTTCTFLCSTLGATSIQDTQHNEANAYYEKGLSATLLMERQNAFNQALTLYKKLELTNRTFFPYDRIDQSIGDTYFQLGEYPRAILYDYRGLKNSPNSSVIRDHLQRAQQKLNLPPSLHLSTADRLLSFNFLLGLPERFQLFFLISLLAILISSLSIWVPKKLLSNFRHLTLFLSFLMLLNILASLYLSPLEGIIVESSKIYREPSFQVTPLFDYPLEKGIKVDVLDVQKQGNWLKIRTNEVIGYIPSRSIIII